MAPGIPLLLLDRTNWVAGTGGLVVEGCGENLGDVRMAMMNEMMKACKGWDANVTMVFGKCDSKQVLLMSRCHHQGIFRSQEGRMQIANV